MDPLLAGQPPLERESRPSFRLALAMVCAECDQVYEANPAGCSCGCTEAFSVAKRMNAAPELARARAEALRLAADAVSPHSKAKTMGAEALRAAEAVLREMADEEERR
jgi:hypothetical protein